MIDRALKYWKMIAAVMTVVSLIWGSAQVYFSFAGEIEKNKSKTLTLEESLATIQVLMYSDKWERAVEAGDEVAAKKWKMAMDAAEATRSVLEKIRLEKKHE